MNLRNWKSAPVLLVLAAGLAGPAKASDVMITVTGAVSGSLDLTLGADPYADPTGTTFGTPANSTSLGGPPPNQQGVYDPMNALAVTAVSGTFNGQTVTGIVATNPQPHFDPDYTIPYSFGWYPNPGAVSYDNLFYAGAAAPITCAGVPAGGFFDDYGVMFTLTNGDVVDLYSNGGTGPGAYGVVVWSDGAADYTNGGGLSVATPELSTWAMMGLGFATLAASGARLRRRAVARA